jgi:hypothetical protein
MINILLAERERLAQQDVVPLDLECTQAPIGELLLAGHEGPLGERPRGCNREVSFPFPLWR